jgi:hypothetical protein
MKSTRKLYLAYSDTIESLGDSEKAAEYKRKRDELLVQDSVRFKDKKSLESMPLPQEFLDSITQVSGW